VRLLHVAQPTTEGTAAVVVQLAGAAVAAGHDVTVASPPGGDLPDRAAGVGARWAELPLARRPGLRDLWAVLALRRRMRCYDVVHLHSSKAGAVGRLAAASLRHRPAVVFTPHGWSWYSSERLRAAYLRFERWAARHADATVAVSAEEYADGLARLGGRSRLRLIENGVDTRVYLPDEAPREPASILCVGRLSAQKGQDRLLRAVARLGRPGLRLTLAGDGPAEAELRRLAFDLGIAEAVSFVGRVDPLPLYQRATIVAMPSRWEGLSIAMLEAMAAGSAIVATAVGGAGMLAGAGRLVEGGSEEQIIAALAGALERLLDDPDLRDQIGRAARERAEERYSLERVARDHLTLWAELVTAR